MAITWPQFAATPAGTRIFNNGFDQCVAVANRQNEEVLGLPFVPVDSAFQWWSLRHVIGTLANNYTPSATPAPGAIVVWAGAGWNAQHGHIGSVLEVLPNGEFITLEQNAGPKARFTYQHRRSVRDAGLQGFLIPKSNPALPGPVEPLTSPEEDDMAQNAGIYYTDGKRQVNAIVNTTSGYFGEYVEAGAYNNPIAVAFDTKDFAKVTQMHFEAIKRQCAEVRTGK